MYMVSDKVYKHQEAVLPLQSIEVSKIMLMSFSCCRGKSHESKQQKLKSQKKILLSVTKKKKKQD
jgi:hypothetical protein